MGALDFPLEELVEDGRLAPGEFIHFTLKQKKSQKLKKFFAVYVRSKESA